MTEQTMVALRKAITRIIQEEDHQGVREALERVRKREALVQTIMAQFGSTATGDNPNTGAMLQYTDVPFTTNVATIREAIRTYSVRTSDIDSIKQAARTAVLAQREPGCQHIPFGFGFQRSWGQEVDDLARQVDHARFFVMSDDVEFFARATLVMRDSSEIRFLLLDGPSSRPVLDCER